MAQIGVCTVEVVGNACADFQVIDNLTMTSLSSFDWELTAVFFFGILTMWIIGMKYGYTAKFIKNSAKIR